MGTFPSIAGLSCPCSMCAFSCRAEPPFKMTSHLLPERWSQDRDVWLHTQVCPHGWSHHTWQMLASVCRSISVAWPSLFKLLFLSTLSCSSMPASPTPRWDPAQASGLNNCATARSSSPLNSRPRMSKRLLDMAISTWMSRLNLTTSHSACAPLGAQPLRPSPELPLCCMLCAPRWPHQCCYQGRKETQL